MTNADPQQRGRRAVRAAARPVRSHTSQDSTPQSTVARSAVRGLVAWLVALAGLVVLASPSAAQTPAWVDTGGDCLLLRTEPGLAAGNYGCLDHGEPITLLADQVDQDGFSWRLAEHEGQVGWVAEFYVTTDPDAVQVLYETGTESTGIPVPPQGGLTMGLAGTTIPAAVAAAQPYEVVSVWHFDHAAQRFLHYFPGAPAFANTLTTLAEDSVVVIRRAGSLGDLEAVPEPPLTVAGTPNLLPVPPIGGLTQGLSGTTDPYFLVMAQEFTTETVSYFHIPSQTWLSYIPGAPDHVNTLQQGHLRVDSVVTLRRGPDAPRTQVTSEESDYFETSITYYYCAPGENPASIGDGGGYCGVMSNGERVYEGAAACAPRHLGQRFRIEGDPTERIYTCTDAGGSVLHDHRDVWFPNSDDGYAWWIEVGDRAFIEIIHDGQEALSNTAGE